jgi:hypothetical protein
MSVYRFARMSALLAFAGKYRLKIFYMAAAAAFAAVTSWLYADIAVYLDAHHPQWVGAALVCKTVIVYGALFFLLWQVKPSERSGNSVAPGVSTPTVADGKPSRLDALAEKPRLTSRKDAILKK